MRFLEINCNSLGFCEIYSIKNQSNPIHILLVEKITKVSLINAKVILMG